MIKEAIYMLVSLGAVKKEEHPSGDPAGDLFIGAGRVVSRPNPTPAPLATEVTLKTLESFAKMTVANVDGFDLSKCIIVASGSRVYLATNLNASRSREIVIVANHVHDWEKCVGWTLTLREILPMLGANFEDAGDLGKLIGLLSSVSLTNTVKQGREGLGFRITADEWMDGGGEWAEVKDPYFTLHPFRMFPEAGAQPGSRFLVDVDVKNSKKDEGRPQITVKLTCADGNSWEPTAARSVAESVEHRLKSAAKEIKYTGPLPVVCS